MGIGSQFLATCVGTNEKSPAPEGEGLDISTDKGSLSSFVNGDIAVGINDGT